MLLKRKGGNKLLDCGRQWEDRAENEINTKEMHQAKHRVCARMHVLQYLLLTVSGSRAKSINFNMPLIKSLCTLKFETE